MRVLVVSANRETQPDPVAPLGAAYLAASLIEAGHEVEFLDLCFREDPAGDLSEALDRARPGAVCFSLRNIGGAGAMPAASTNASPSRGGGYLSDYQLWARIVKEKSGAPLIIGGPAVSILPAEMLEALDADFAVAGESEEAAPALLRAIAEGRGASEVPGAYERGNGAARASTRRQPARLAALDRLPLPARHLIDNARYHREGGCANLQTKRGCDRACIYCTYPILEGRTPRVRDPRKVVDEIVHLREAYGIRHVFFVDSLFNHPIAHAEAICEEILRRRPEVELSCYANPAFFTDRLARLFAEAGFVAVEFGTDSGSDEILASLGKGFGKREVADASRLCREHGLKFCHSLVFGAPGETWKTVRETCDFIDSLEPAAVVAMAGFSVYPETALARRADIPPASRPGEPPLYVSPAVREGLLELLQAHGDRMDNWILPTSSLNMNSRIHDLFRRHGVLGPLWRRLAVKRSRRVRSLTGPSRTTSEPG